MYNSSMFASIKDALAKSEKSGGNPLYKEILKFKAGHTYVLRLLPNVNDPSKTFFHYFQHGWNSFATGEYVSALSLQTIGKPDPIGIETFRIKKNGTEEQKQKVQAVKWQEQWYVNVYVIDDPVTPANNGCVKIFRFGKKLNNIIESAISGDDSDEFGARVFDLTKDGVNFKLKAEKQGEYTTYDSSRFTSPVSLNLTDEKSEQIYNSVHDLTSVNQIKSEEELMEMWNKHFVVKDIFESKPQNKTPVSSLEQEETVDDLSTKELSDEMVNELLKGYDQ
jgi:gp32 DNA binding protein like